MNIPQADDINKIIEFPLRVFEVYDTSVKMISAFGFVKTSEFLLETSSRTVRTCSVR